MRTTGFVVVVFSSQGCFSFSSLSPLFLLSFLAHYDRKTKEFVLNTPDIEVLLLLLLLLLLLSLSSSTSSFPSSPPCSFSFAFA
jgi:hypothetical protein